MKGIITGALYVVVIVVMAVATIVEKYKGTAYVSEYWYGAWWFVALWALLTAAAIVYFVRSKVKKAFVVTLHLAFVVILAGALLTHLTAQRGVLHLRKGETAKTFLVQKGDDIQERPLPFAISLMDFRVEYHEGTTAPADYVTTVSIAPKGQPTNRASATISMNNILSRQGFRLYQSDYDHDLQGSILSVNSDPWGIPVTYVGYALLFVSLIWMLFEPRKNYKGKVNSETTD